MTSKTYFSVIIATYNRAEMLKRAISSVLNQKFQSFEIIVVDDASTDDTELVVKQIADKRINYIKNKRNLHKGGARNVGIKAAQGNFICFLDDDDYYLPHHLKTFADKLQGIPNFDGLLFTMPISQLEGEITFQKRVLSSMEDQHPVAYLFHHKNGVPTPRACVTAKIAKGLLFNPEIRIGQDTEFFLRIAAENEVLPINAHTVVQVRHDDNSGALKYNTGKDRLDGYRFIFENANVSKHIPKSLKHYMISYCYRRMSDHYEYVGDRQNTLRSALKALYYSPFDQNIKIKMAHILYNLPLVGSLMKRVYRNLKS